VRMRAYRDGEATTVLPVEDGRARERHVDVHRRVIVRTGDIYRDGEHERLGLELGIELEAGDSGSPVVGRDGSLLAVVWATSRRQDDRAWATRVEALDPLLARARAGAPPASVPCAR
jgi:hypothetical protein